MVTEQHCEHTLALGRTMTLIAAEKIDPYD